MFRKQKGITLIALVRTIIVLLILAAVSITALTDEDKGVVTKAKQAAKKTEEASDQEDADIKEITDYADSEDWGNAGGENLPDVPEAPTYTAYSVGAEVTLKSDSNEQFYVIKASGEDEEKVTLLAKNNIDTTSLASLAQSDSAGRVAFCSIATYNSLGNDLTSVESLNDDATIIADTTSAVYYARKYAEQITGNEEDGRLMTHDEANTLKASYSSMIYGTETTAGYLNYWLGSAGYTNRVWSVFGGSSDFYNYYYDVSGICGVRPVIEISKSLIQ